MHIDSRVDEADRRFSGRAANNDLFSLTSRVSLGENRANKCQVLKPQVRADVAFIK